MASSPSGSRLFALIIGIDYYTEETGFDMLKGAVRDANRIRDWLISDFNVPPAHIQDLRDEAATREAIIQALKGLSADPKIRHGDPIVIYYAGHGTETPAPKRWRWNAPNIQMIVPWDFKHTESPDRIIQGIPDRTLGALLTKLADEKGDNITVIFDSCYSGSGTRSGPDTRIRGGPCAGEIPDDLDDDIVRAASTLVLTASSTRGVRVLNKFRHHGLRSHVLLAACAPDEPALENKTSGAFTGALLKALHGVNTAELTYEGLIERMDKLKTQSPQCEGYYRGRYLFNRKVASTNPVLDASFKRDNLKLTIAGAGAIHGISLGSKFAIWKSRKDLHTEPLATVTVDMVKGKDSVATLSMMDAESVVDAGSDSLVAQIKENPKPMLYIHVPKTIQGMDCFKNLISETKGRPPLSVVVVENEDLASIGLTYLDRYNQIGFEMLNPEEQGQKILHTIDAKAEDLHGALDHLCHYYYHRDRVNPNHPVIGEPGEDKIPFSSKFTVDVFTLDEKDEGIYVPTGPNLNIQGTGVQLTVGAHNKDDFYGFRIVNNTKLPVFPYLFYFNSSDFSIIPVYQPIAVAQTGAKSIHPLQGQGGSLTVGYGSVDAPPQTFAISDERLDLEQGYLRLYVSTQHVDLSTLKKNPISTQTRGLAPAVPNTPPIWDAITVPVVLKWGERPPSIPMVGIVGSRGSGKSTFLNELFKSLLGNTSLKPSFKNAFISEYDITLPGPNKETLTLVDLPAFEDYNIDNHASVLKAMVAYLGEQHQRRRRLTSLIWCYNISKPKITPVDRESLNLVEDISGPDALKNVTVLTTNWNKLAEVGANAARQRSVAAAASPLQRFKNAETALKSLCKGVEEINWKRFGTFSDPVARKTALGSTSAGDPLELIRSLLSNEGGFQVQREACETRKLAGTTAGKRLQKRFKTEIEKKGEIIRRRDQELDDLDDDTGRKVIQEEKDDAEQDIIRWRGMLERIEAVNSAFA